MKWEDTKEGRMSIYFFAVYLAASMGEEAYVDNKDAKVGDDNKIVNFLRELIITEWVN